MKNYTLISTEDLSEKGRLTMHEQLGLSGAEISFNQLPAGVNVPFIHKHKQNEEIYVILEGSGYLSIDDEVIDIKKGDVFKISPNGERCIKACEENAISFMCIQVKENSLNGFSETDGVILEEKPKF